MEGIKEVQNLVEKLRKKTLEVFPGCTNASFAVDAEGYMSMTVTKWDKNEWQATEHRKRKEVFDQYRLAGERKWSEDRSGVQNDYYKRCGLLLEEEKE